MPTWHQHQQTRALFFPHPISTVVYNIIVKHWYAANLLLGENKHTKNNTYCEFGTWRHSHYKSQIIHIDIHWWYLVRVSWSACTGAGGWVRTSAQKPHGAVQTTSPASGVCDVCYFINLESFQIKAFDFWSTCQNAKKNSTPPHESSSQCMHLCTISSQSWKDTTTN